MFKKTLLGISLLTLITVSSLAVPNQLTYSGRLLQNGALVNAPLTMTFKIYDDPTSVLPSDLLWSTININVDVNQGIYSVVLDQVSPNALSGDNAYLEVIIGSEVLAPRTKINSVGYALQAGGLSYTGGQAVAVSVNGYVGIGTSLPSVQLDVNGNIAHSGYRMGSARQGILGSSGGDYASVGYGYLPSATTGIYKYGVPDTASQLLFHVGGFHFKTAPIGVIGNNVTFNNVMSILQNGNVGMGISAPGASLQLSSMITGNLAMKVDAKDFNGVMQNNALVVSATGNVGIGTNAPGGKLHIYGNNNSLGNTNSLIIETNGYSVGDAQNIQWKGNGIEFGRIGTKFVASGVSQMRFENLYASAPQSATHMVIQSDGNVGIGLTNPSAKLHVAGTAYADTVSYQNSVLNIGNSLVVNGASWVKLFTMSWLSRATLQMYIYGDSRVHRGTYTITAGDWKADASTVTIEGPFSQHIGTALQYITAVNTGGAVGSPIDIYAYITPANSVTLYWSLESQQGVTAYYNTVVGSDPGGSKLLTFPSGAMSGYITSTGTNHYLNGPVQVNSSLQTTGTLAAGTSLYVGNATGAPYWYSGKDGAGSYVEHVGTNNTNSLIRFQTSVNGARSAYSSIMIDPAKGFSFNASSGASGKVGIGTTDPKSALHVNGLPTYADNTAALAGGLTAGAFYRTATGVLMVVY
ncbi:MAG: hypothetical protein WC838_00715 [Candidatus Margulisiibacteriota bacterium]